MVITNKYLLLLIVILGAVFSTADAAGGEDIEAARQASKTLEARGVQVSVKELSEFSKNSGNSVSDRSKAILALGQFDDPIARQEISSALSDSAADIRGSAITSMKIIDDQSFVAEIAQRLQQDPSEMVRLRAIDALTSIGGQQARVELALSVRDTDQSEDVRIAALYGVENTSNDAGQNLALSLLSDENTNVKVTAAVIAAHHDAITMVPYLLDAVSDSSLPIWLWCEAVIRLEVGADERFVNLTPKEFMRKPDEYRSEIQAKVEEWANGRQ